MAVIAFDRQCYFLSGLLLAAALNVKLIPLVLLPLVFLGVPNRRALLHLTSGLAIGVAPFVVPALAAGPAMYRNMVAYNSIPDNWGIVAVLRSCLHIAFLGKFAAAMLGAHLAAGRYAVLASVTAVALLSRFRRRLPMAEQAALGAALFLLLTPGFGLQYVVFVAPLLCLVDLPAALGWAGCRGCLSVWCTGHSAFQARTSPPFTQPVFPSPHRSSAWLPGRSCCTLCGATGRSGACRTRPVPADSRYPLLTQTRSPATLLQSTWREKE